MQTDNFTDIFTSMVMSVLTQNKDQSSYKQYIDNVIISLPSVCVSLHTEVFNFSQLIVR